MILFVVILVPSLLFLWQWFFRRHWEEGLEVRLGFDEDMVYAGEQAGLTEVIANRKRLPLTELEIGFRIPKGTSFLNAENTVVSDYLYKRDVFSLRGMEAVTRRYRLECPQRGRYQISQITLCTWSFFHEREYSVELDGSDELLVYAQGTDVSRILALCDTILGASESTRSLYEDPFLFSSIREYTPRDPMNRINWKATARMGSLMVNTYASVCSEQFFVFLDVADRRILQETELVELGISAAASLCRHTAREGQETGLAVNTVPPAVFEPKRGLGQLRQIEQLLTEDFTGKELMGAEDFARLPLNLRGRICIFISKELDAGTEQALRGRPDLTLPAILVVPEYRGDSAVLTVRGLYTLV